MKIEGFSFFNLRDATRITSTSRQGLSYTHDLHDRFKLLARMLAKSLHGPTAFSKRRNPAFSISIIPFTI
jgi:hypothetical protein